MIYYWFVLGAAIGSFLNVLIHRLPRGESIVFPSSYCPSCRSRILSIDLVPILGYFFLLGRCRKCKAPISFRYPLVEIIAGTLFTLTWIFTGGEYLSFFFFLIFISAAIVLFFIDLEQQVIPDSVSFPVIVCGLIFNYIRSSFFSALIGAVLGFIFLFFISQLGKYWYKKEVMGEGDWMMAAMLGAFLGWDGVLLALFLAFLLAATVAIILLIFKKAKFGQMIPFGPALAAGGLIVLYWGEPIIKWYGRLIF